MDHLLKTLKDHHQDTKAPRTAKALLCFSWCLGVLVV
jgi:hypothetical protein